MDCVVFKDEKVNYIVPLKAVSHVLRLDSTSEKVIWKNNTLPLVRASQQNIVSSSHPKVAIIKALFKDNTIFPYFALLMDDDLIVKEFQEADFAWIDKPDKIRIRIKCNESIEAKILNLKKISEWIESKIANERM